jgi:undecaprenyl-diphosphatase
MNIWQAIVLGMVQGLTEFLPISSSGHLLLVPELLGWQEQPLSFDVALHIGTSLAIVAYFWHDWWTLIRSSLGDLRCHGLRLIRWGPYGRLTLLIGVGTVPAVIAGLLLADLESTLRTPGVVATMLIIVGGYMAAAERWAPRHADSRLERITWVGALLVGVAQACALVPGVSRSGSTIATGMFTGLGRATAARFSFLMATPVTVAAMVKELPQLRDAADQGISRGDIAAGIIASLVVGVLAIRFLLRYLATRTLYPFAIYRVAVALLVLGVLVR